MAGSLFLSLPSPPLLLFFCLLKKTTLGCLFEGYFVRCVFYNRARDVERGGGWIAAEGTADLKYLC